MFESWCFTLRSHGSWINKSLNILERIYTVSCVLAATRPIPKRDIAINGLVWTQISTANFGQTTTHIIEFMGFNIVCRASRGLLKHCQNCMYDFYQTFSACDRPYQYNNRREIGRLPEWNINWWKPWASVDNNPM